MKDFKIICFALLFIFTGFNSFSQQTKPTNGQEFVQKTFSVEINADTTLDDLKKIEQMLRNGYNVSVAFENVEIVDDKIVSIRMQLVNGNQSFMKSVNNYNRAIDPFSITLTEDGIGKYYASLQGNSPRNIFNYSGKNAFSAFDSLSENSANLQSEFSSFGNELELMYQEIQASQQRFQELFKSFQKEANQTTDRPKNNTATKTQNQLK